jgi:hypothetical protein
MNPDVLNLFHPHQTRHLVALHLFPRIQYLGALRVCAPITMSSIPELSHRFSIIPGAICARGTITPALAALSSPALSVPAVPLSPTLSASAASSSLALFSASLALFSVGGPIIPDAICVGGFIIPGAIQRRRLHYPWRYSASAAPSSLAHSASVAHYPRRYSAPVASLSSALFSVGGFIIPGAISVGGSIIPGAIQRRRLHYPWRYSASAAPSSLAPSASAASLSPALFSVGGSIIPGAIQRRRLHHPWRYSASAAPSSLAHSASVAHYPRRYSASVASSSLAPSASVAHQLSQCSLCQWFLHHIIYLSAPCVRCPHCYIILPFQAHDHMMHPSGIRALLSTPLHRAYITHLHLSSPCLSAGNMFALFGHTTSPSLHCLLHSSISRSMFSILPGTRVLLPSFQV